jgi:predicted transcriptional regulator
MAQRSYLIMRVSASLASMVRNSSENGSIRSEYNAYIHSKKSSHAH